MILRIIACCLSLLVPVLTWAADDDFGPATKIDTGHFTIYYKSGVDINNLISQLHVSQADQILANQTVNASSPQIQLSNMVEVLFAHTSDVLDMHIYSLKVNIKIFATQQDLADFYNNLFHARIPCTGYGFYLDDARSIYMSAGRFRRAILAHEMGHAIMSRYFVIQPSVRIQEVLAGFIEYQLRKSQG
jgi:hypothetical protein